LRIARALRGLRLANPQGLERLAHYRHRGHPRDDAEELAHIAHGASAQLEDLPRLGGDHVHHGVAVAHEDLARLRTVVAVDGSEQRALAGSRGVGEDHALSRVDP
jgi:hypothetical protein